MGLHGKLFPCSFLSCSSFLVSSFLVPIISFEMKLTILLPLTGAVSVCATGLQERASNWTIGQTVNTTSGPVNGHPAANQSSVSQYLGIPFAQPPIGDLRFAAPVKYTGNSTLNGTSYVSFSVQLQDQLLTAMRRVPIVQSRALTRRVPPCLLFQQQT